MRENRIKRAFREGRAVIGTNAPFTTPETVEFFGLLGYDFYFIDGEHQSLGAETAQQLVRAANGAGIEPVVRVPFADPGLILTFLETGASTVLVPHCKDAETARRAVRAVKYPPLGDRGGGSSTRAADYGLTATPGEYFAAANQQTVVLPMIEEPEAVANLDAILAVEGLEAIFIGPTDLSLSMGYPGQPGHPEVQAAISRVVDAAVARGIRVGTTARDAETTRALLDRGISFILCSAGPLIAATCRKYLADARQSRS